MDKTFDKEGRLVLKFEYADPNQPFALVEELWAENYPKLAVYEGAAQYHRLPQFGGDPDFRDVWYIKGLEGQDALFGSDEFFEHIVKMAIQTEIDQATLGHGSDELPGRRLSANPARYEVEMYEFIRNGIDIDMTGEMPFEAFNFITHIAVQAANRVARALATIY